MVSDSSDLYPSLLAVALAMGWTWNPLVQSCKISGLSLQARTKAGTFYIAIEWSAPSASNT